MNLRDLLITTMDQLAGNVRGLVVDHRGFSMRLVANGDNRWSAYAWADDGAEGQEVEGVGVTPIEALDDCANDAAEIENPSPDGEDSEDGEDDDPLMWPAQICPECDKPVGGETIHRDNRFHHPACLGMPEPELVDDGDDCPF